MAGTVVAVAAAVALPLLMVHGHGRRQRDAAARVGDTLLGVVWVLFAWSVLGLVASLVMGARIAAVAVLAVALVLVVYGLVEARRVPRVREVVDRRAGRGRAAGRGADRHPLRPDRPRALVGAGGRGGERPAPGPRRAPRRPGRRLGRPPCAAGRAARRRARPDGRYYIPGNHEHYGGAAQWVEHMRGLGWQPLVNEHRTIGDGLVLAGVDDPTGAPDLAAALAGADPAKPVLLLAHQPSQVTAAAAAGVALQLSGHTHGGQIWPFHLLVRTNQPVLAGLSRHGAAPSSTSAGAPGSGVRRCGCSPPARSPC